MAVHEKFSAEELELFREVFKEFDRDGDQTIDLRELGAVMEELGQSCTPEIIQEMVSTVDADKTGSIDFEEFVELMARKTLGEIQEEVDDDDDKGVDYLEADVHTDETNLSMRQAIQVLTELLERLECTELVDEDADDDADVEDDAGGKGVLPEKERIQPISVPAAIEVAQRHRLLGARHPSDFDDWRKLAEHLHKQREVFGMRLFEEEGYIEVHCEDDDPCATGADDAFDGEVDLEEFTFKDEKDPENAVGEEAYRVSTSGFPFYHFPVSSVVQLLTDESLRDSYGYLPLNHFSLHDKGVIGIAEVIRRDSLRSDHPDPKLRCDPLIRHVELRHNFITPAGGNAVVQAMQTRGCLVHHLDMSHNNLGHKGALLPKGHGVVSTILTQGHKHDFGANHSCPSCREWHRARGIGASVKALLTQRAPPSQLQVLCLSHNNLGDSDVKLIAEGLAENGKLHELDLSHNNLGYASAVALAEMLKNNYDLRVLKVGWNKLEAAGTNYLLANGLVNSGTLQEIDLSWTGIQDAPPGSSSEGGGKLLAKVVTQSYLKKINVSHNKISTPGAMAIAAALKTNTTLQSFNLSHNPLTSAGVKEILRGLRENQTIEDIDMTATLAGPSIKDARAGEDVDVELKDAKKKRDLARPPGKDAGNDGTWQVTEDYRKNCYIFCPECERMVRTVTLHDDIPGVGHRLGPRRSDDPPGIPTDLRLRIKKMKCQVCHHVQPPSSFCVSCSTRFSDPGCGGIMITFLTQGDHTKSQRCPSPPGPDKGYHADDLPRGFHIMSKKAGPLPGPAKGSAPKGKKAVKRR